ncbi:molybdopterin molybdotransferase MoeA [Cytobacillus gottheilii]|uniref:molybdopterin molybdotransferase MoeA n=1 Tax=Cytobacillus gottheilii TaxID=859144 RepID=UPI0009B9A1DD|nr:gephyrin-like molybdotransferase Glp [Cytobacillus gottheilii]
MLEKRNPIQIADAVARVMKYEKKGEAENSSIYTSNGRYLADDIKATHDVPHFDRAPYDGFALRSVDTAQASQRHEIEFEVIDHIGAGHVTNKIPGAFQAVRIMTGAQMPEGCDAVLMLELSKTFEKNGNTYMSTKRKLKKGENVSFKGEDAKAGKVLIHKGTLINPGTQAVLATFGYADVPVAKKPAIALFATGSELLEVEDDLEPGKIRNSNALMITAQIERAGGKASYLGKLPDDFETCFNAVEKALQESDFLITTGGVSVGDFDYLPAIYEKLGAEVLFNKVAMRPGSVTTVAQLDGKLLFGLSGNPSACYVGFELFVRPIIRTFLFSDKPHLRREKAILTADFPKANPFTRFVRAILSVEDGKLVAAPSGMDKSNIVMSLAGANALMILPGGSRGFMNGDEVDVLLLEEFTGSEWPW